MALTSADSHKRTLELAREVGGGTTVAVVVWPSCPKILAALRRFGTFLSVSASAPAGISAAGGRTRQGKQFLVNLCAYAYDLLRRDGHTEDFGKVLPWLNKKEREIKRD